MTRYESCRELDADHRSEALTKLEKRTVLTAVGVHNLRLERHPQTR